MTSEREYTAVVERVRSHVAASVPAGGRAHYLVRSPVPPFPGAANAGLSAARGGKLVLLGDDTIVPPGWLEWLVRHLDDATLGFVGDRDSRPFATPMRDAKYATYGGLLRFARMLALGANAVTDVCTVPLSCAAFRRDALEQVGGLDDGLTTDAAVYRDYSTRIRSAGLRVVAAEQVVVHRFGWPASVETGITADDSAGCGW